jgi:uncharacterized protein (TIGR01777 family)
MGPLAFFDKHVYLISMKIVIAGGTGQLGQVLGRGFSQQGHQVVVLGRRPSQGVVPWDGRTLGPWAEQIDGAEVVINLAGRTVNCRYHKHNLAQMMHSRVDSTRVVGEAIAAAARPPRVWLQMSTATIYAHRLDAANDELTGRIGGDEPDAPGYWRLSTDIAKAWERTLQEAPTPRTRKVAIRSAYAMSPDRGGIFDTLLWLVRWGWSGAYDGGEQYMSWMHDVDFARAAQFVMEHEDLEGPVNFAAPGPLPQRELMRILREAWGGRLSLPARRWMLELGALLLQTDTELVLKSRRVVPTRLVQAGFTFQFPRWEEAARDLVARWCTPA